MDVKTSCCGMALWRTFSIPFIGLFSFLAFSEAALAQSSSGTVQSAVPSSQPELATEQSEFSRLVGEGEALAGARDFGSAIQWFDRALKLGAPTVRDESTALTFRAGALAHLGRHDEAVRDHNRAVMLDLNAFTRWARGETLRKIGRLADAMEDYDAVLRLAPTDAPAWVGRATVLSRLGKQSEAKSAFDQAVNIKPDIHSLTHRASFSVSQRNFDGAIEDYSKVIQLDPASLSARINRANAYAERGNYNKALEDYEAALQANAGNALVYRGRGWVFERQGQLERARADYVRALQLAPNDPWLKNALGNLPPPR